MHRNASSGDSVNRRFRYIVSVVYAVILALLLWLFFEQWRGYQDAREAQREFVVLQAALRSMADVSAERRPTFVWILTPSQTQEQHITALKAARRATDADLSKLDASLQNTRCKSCASLLHTFARVKSTLTEARQNLDAIYQRAPNDRTDVDMLLAVDHLVSVIPLLSSIADTSAMGVIRENADVQSYLLAARLAALLREQAGHLGSIFVPATPSHRALTADEQSDVARTLGAIEQLRILLLPSIRTLPSWLQADYAQIDQHFFGEELAEVDRASSTSISNAPPAVLADRCAPRVEPINRFRDDTLALARDTIRSSLHWHIVLLGGATLLVWALTAILLLMSWRFREKIVRPFVEARRLILAIAASDLSLAIPVATYSGEIKDLFSALNVLKQHSAERIRLEQERKRLIGELKAMAETDPLTGLLNRRAFESRARVLLSDKRGDEPDVALIMLDIDHFKHVNDTYGHETGDRALVKLAAMCRETIRSEDVVARIGGEEFVILLRVPNHAQAYELAQRLRSKLHQDTIVAIGGEIFGIRASFGIAFGRRADTPRTDELLRRADALLYQAKQNGRDRIEVEAAA
jgi:diguanylate cyclase (GGDEF)-like protein